MTTAPDPQYIELLRRYRAQGGIDLREELHTRYLELGRGALTPAGLPFPDPTDPVAEGADAIRALADAIRIITGAVVIAGSGGNNFGQEPIAFPAGVFTTPPVVLTGSVGNTTGTSLLATALNISPAGATIRLNLNTGGAFGQTYTIPWIAIQIQA